ncbi:MAG: hypothetical protein ACK502_08945 [Alphaproteobacteria bacterium]
MFPAADKPFPILDRIVLNHICGGSKPLDCTQAQWVLTHSDDTVFQHQRIHYTGGVRTQTHKITLPPDGVLTNPDKYIMVHVPHKSEDVAPLAGLNVQPGYVLDDQLKDRYGLAARDDYAVYHVRHPKSKMGIVLQLFSSAMPPDEYTIVVSRSAYKRLAVTLLEKLANLNQAKEIFSAPSAASLKQDYKNPQSAAVAKIRAVVENANLDQAELVAIIDRAVINEQYEFAAAMREIAADLFPEAGFKHRAAIELENKQKGIGGHSPA